MRSQTGEVILLLLAGPLFLGDAQLNPASLHSQLAQIGAAEAQQAPLEAQAQPAQQGGAEGVGAGGTSAALLAGKVQAQQPAASNPVLNIYLQETLSYEKDAQEAERAAQMYQKMTHDVLQGPLKAETASITAGEMNRIGVNTWGHAVLSFEDMLYEQAGAKGAAAAAKAVKPYNKILAGYVKAQNAYDTTAMAYDLRIPGDENMAKQLITYANQYRLQGNDDMADKYDNMATTYIEQAEKFAGTAQNYFKMAVKINQATPGIQKMAGIAGTHAAWTKNPANVVPASHLFPFTPVPPLEFVQTGRSDERASAVPASPASFLGSRR